MAFLAVASAVLGMAGSVVGAVGARNEGEANANAAEYNAKVGEINAAAERDRAAVEASDYERKMSRERATAIASRGASGIDLAGTPLMVDEDIVNEIALGSSRITHEGAVKANAYENQANLDRTAAKNFKKAGKLSAAATLLSGASRAFNNYPQAGRTAGNPLV